MKYLTCIFSFLISLSALGQTTDYNKIILPQTARDVEFSEKLVQIAWQNHPDNHVVQKEVEVAEYDLKKSRRQWFESIQFVGNLNEFNIDPSRDVTNRSQFYPRYNVSARVGLGMFFIIPIDNKQKKVQTSIARDLVNTKKLEVRRTVLQAYNTYVMYRDIYNIQSLVQQDAESSHQLVEENFKNGETSFNNYNTSLNNFNNSKINKLQSENNYLNAKLDLESLIGMRLEDVN